MTARQGGDEVLFVPVRNAEGQYSVWWVDRPVPEGWVAVGAAGTRTDCLDRIAERWTDLRPASTR